MHARPKYLNLLQIRLPLPALVSIMHRVSGAVLFFALPLLLWGFQRSLASLSDYATLRAMLGHGLVKLILIALAWAYLHHLCAGIRHLALDLDCGTDLATGRLTARLALGAGIVLAAAAGVLLW